MHSVAVCALMVALAKRMGMPDDQVREAGVAGLMHDVGKMMIASAVLNKPGRLTRDEFEIIKAHPELGVKILMDTQPVAASVIDVCLHHHEKVDGSGYPHGLKGDQISIFARMGAVCDVYDAITSDRPYKRAGALPIRFARWRHGRDILTIWFSKLRQDRGDLPDRHTGTPGKRAPRRGGRTR